MKIARWLGLLAILAASVGGALATSAYAQVENPNPPASVVKLIFIHHSTGENWIKDDYGNLGRTLGENNYFVSDTNYGWGPDGIGDRTDIVNWTEWFRGPDSERILAALYAESGQNSQYTRDLPDPGGENQVILFKSCFSNSNLEGNPDDPPAPGDGLTVSNAKYIYNDLLSYFITRPDKLFILVTAPPVQDPTYAAHARAFNNWLAQDWLRENNYPNNNVAVFDFYNVLTHPDNHHRLANGAIEYINSNGNNTSYYPSSADDDHPSAEGSQKATGEFVPLLNVFYNRWRAGAPAQAPVAQATAPVEEPAPVSPPVAGNQLVDDFEAGPPAGTGGWNPYWDETTRTQISCAPEAGIQYSGNSALHANFDVEANSWATCALMYEPAPDWSFAQGLSFYAHASQPAMVFDVNAYFGSMDAKETYLYSVETTQEMVDGWVYLEIPWENLLRADWEENAGTPFNPAIVRGVSFGFNTPPDASNTGEIWIDDIYLMGAPESGAAPTSPAGEALATPAPVAIEPGAIEETAPAQTPEATKEPETGNATRRLCPGSAAIGFLAITGVVWGKRRRRSLE